MDRCIKNVGLRIIVIAIGIPLCAEKVE